MKCLVTGAAGFIGSHIVDRLLSEGHDVVGVDNFVTGSRDTIAHLSSHPHFRFVEHDCVKPLPKDITAEVIYHFASPASPPKYQLLPVETLLVNTVGTQLLLENARTWQATFVYASTSEVYGDPKEHPQKETYWGHVNPNGPRSCYDEGKRAGEAFVMAYVRNHGVDGRIVRIFNTYGPRMDIDDGRVVTNFIKQILTHQPITLYGDGSQTRSFCFVTDLVDGIVKLANKPEMRGEVVNLGNTQEQTIQEFATFLKKLTDYDGEFVYQKMPVDDPQQRQPDITRARTLLGWEPKVTLAEGLTLTLEYFKKRT